MPKLNQSDLFYQNYSWSAVPGDDPTKTRADRTRFSRHEGYEVLDLINSFTAPGGGDLDRRTRLIIEWMLHEKLPANIQARDGVMQWVSTNYPTLSAEYPN